MRGLMICMFSVMPMAFLIPFAHAADAPTIRESGVIYLSDFDLRPLKLKVPSDATGYLTKEMNRYLGTLRGGQSVVVQAIKEEPPHLLRVKGQAQQGQTLAWVSPDDLEPLPEGFLEKLKRSQERLESVNALIAKNEVAIGMTPGEVMRSLGKPVKKTARANKEKTEETWEYIHYKWVPQQTYAVAPNGQLVASTIYVKVQDGRLAVHFENNLVSTLEQSEGTILNSPQVQVVVPPIIVY